MTEPILISDEAGRQKALNEIAHLDLDDKKWEITVKRHRKRRSLKQNNLMWMWIDEITPYVSEATGYEKDEIHELFKQNFLPHIKLEMGDLTAERYSTKDLDTKEMSEYCDRIHRWASGFGITLPLPPERGYDSNGRPLAPEQVEQANGADGDRLALVLDHEAAIVLAANGDRLVEVTALYQDELDSMEANSPDSYTRVMRAMENRGQELDHPPAKELHPLQAG